MQGKTTIVVILNNIRSNQNVGSIFRTSDAAGVEKIFLAGYTPAPLDKFGRVNNALVKSALGAEKSVEWEKVKSLKKAIEQLGNDFLVVAVEQDEKSKNYKSFKYPGNVALVFGNEVTGLSKKDLTLCDAVVEIPMKGKKESLNVSVTAGVILFSV